MTTPQSDEVRDQLKGKPLEEAKAIAEAAGYVWRVTSTDGVEHIVTTDARIDRFNFTLEKGIVVAAEVG